MKVKILSRKKKGGRWTPSSRRGLTSGGEGGGERDDDEVAASSPSPTHDDGVGSSPQAGECAAAAGEGVEGEAECALEEEDYHPETPAGKTSLGDRTAVTAEVTVLDRSGSGRGEGSGAHEDDDSGVGHIELQLTDPEEGVKANGPPYRCNGGMQKDAILDSSIDTEADLAHPALPPVQSGILGAGTEHKAERDGGDGKRSVGSGGNKSNRSKFSGKSARSSTSGSSSGASKSRRRRTRREVKMTSEEKDEEIDRLESENKALAEEVRSLSLRACIDKMKHEEREREYESVVKKLVRKGEDRHKELGNRCKELESKLKERDQIIEELQSRLTRLEDDSR